MYAYIHYTAYYIPQVAGHFSSYAGPVWKALNGDHGVHGVWRELSRRQVV
jgi:hypothetical protein